MKLDALAHARAIPVEFIPVCVPVSMLAGAVYYGAGWLIWPALFGTAFPLSWLGLSGAFFAALLLTLSTSKELRCTR
jgi:hypothetical protein